MRRIITRLTLVALAVLAVVAFESHVMAQPPPNAAARPPAGVAAAPVDSFAAERDSTVRELLKTIAGRETLAAESVFKNVKAMKGRTAEQLVRVMNFGFGRSLGVRCQHCHVEGKWADEDKPTKQVARDMMAMTARINDELLPAIKNIRSEKPGVNCGTCHHGTARPGFGPAAQRPRR